MTEQLGDRTIINVRGLERGAEAREGRNINGEKRPEANRGGMRALRVEVVTISLKSGKVGCL